MRVAGLLTFVAGIALFLLAQLTRRSVAGPPDTRLSPNDPVWGLPMKGRLIATLGMLLGALGLALLTAH
jgi:hypothetical protein